MSIKLFNGSRRVAVTMFETTFSGLWILSNEYNIPTELKGWIAVGNKFDIFMVLCMTFT